MSNGAKLAALNKFKSPSPGMMRQVPTKLLVVYDVVVKTPEVPQVPLIINYGMVCLISMIVVADQDLRSTEGCRGIRTSV